MFRAASLRDVQCNIVQPAHLAGDGKFMASITMQRVAEALISENLASDSEVNEVIAGLNAHIESSRFAPVLNSYLKAVIFIRASESKFHHLLCKNSVSHFP